MYLPFQFHNYSMETFRHVINIMYKMPMETRMLLQQNSSVSVMGKVGKNIELDAYVESEIVKPFKSFITAQTTLNRASLIMGNIQVRIVFYSREQLYEWPKGRHQKLQFM